MKLGEFESKWSLYDVFYECCVEGNPADEAEQQCTGSIHRSALPGMQQPKAIDAPGEQTCACVCTCVCACVCACVPVRMRVCMCMCMCMCVSILIICCSWVNGSTTDLQHYQMILPSLQCCSFGCATSSIFCSMLYSPCWCSSVC